MDVELNYIPKSKYLYYKKKIGKGSFSKVYKGMNQETNQIVAIKIISLDLPNNLQNRLKMEINIMKSLNHKYIVNLYDVIYDDDKVYLIMEYSSHGDLSKLLKKRPLKEQYVQKIIKQISSAMKYLISKNIIHRDLKPQNILVFDNNIIKIADFGFARHFDKFNVAETLCGSPLYMSPEIIKYKKYSIKTDLWSIGIILYEMLMGEPPYNAKTHYLLIKKIDKKSVKIPISRNLSNNCINLLQRLLKKESKNRISWDNFFNHPWISEDYDIQKNVYSKKSSYNAIYDEKYDDICDDSSSSSEYENIDTLNSHNIKSKSIYINLKKNYQSTHQPKICDKKYVIVNTPPTNNTLSNMTHSNTSYFSKMDYTEANNRTIIGGLFNYMNKSVNYLKTYLKNIPNSE